MRRILARAKRRSRAFSKVSPSVSLSPFVVVELVCAFYFAKEGSSSSESPASRYTTPVMPTFSLSVEGGGMFETNAKGESEFWRVALFRCLEKVKTLPVLPETVFALLLLLLFLLNVSCSSLFALLQNGLRDRQHRISANFFPVSCPYKSWPKSVNFGQLFETLNPKKLAEIG